MIIAGLALIGFQIITALPQDARAQVASSVEILDLSETWQTSIEVNQIVFDGMGDFLEEFRVAFLEVATPSAESVQGFQPLAAALNGMLQYTDQLAASFEFNYQVNSYVTPGVEAGMGGRILGEYIEKISE